MYKVFNLLSVFIRQFCLSNPYAMYFETSAYADLFNIIIGGTILHLLSFFLTSSIYEKEKHPSWLGCTLYCINYIFNTALISFLCYNFNKLNLTYIISISFIVNLIIWILIGILKKRVYSII